MSVMSQISTVLSATAMLLSLYSLYESTLRAPQLEIFVAPLMDYTDPDRPDSVREVFIMPITIANTGARPATVQLVNLEVVNPRTKQSKTFYGARLGTWGETPPKPFAPAVLAGKATFSQTLQFEPRVGQEVARILDFEAGSYILKVTLDVAAGQNEAIKPRTLQFDMQIGKLDYRYFQGTGTMTMWAPGYQSPTTAAQ